MRIGAVNVLISGGFSSAYEQLLLASRSRPDRVHPREQGRKRLPRSSPARSADVVILSRKALVS
jgi:hypothetical protein